MAKRTRNRQRRQTRTINPRLRPVFWSALLGAAAAAALAAPVYADPALPNAVPNTGARPAPDGVVQLPGAPAIPQPPGANLPLPNLLDGPLAAQVYAKEVELAVLGDQLLKLRPERDAAQAVLTNAERDLSSAHEAVTRAQQAAESAAAEALKDAAQLPPGTFGSDLHGLSALNRLQKGEQESRASAAAREVTAAKTAEQLAAEALAAARAHASALDTQYATLETSRRQAEESLRKLKAENAAQLAAIRRAQDALDRQVGDNLGSGDIVAGMVANPRALAAVRYARSKIGSPYVWGDEGPNTFDCSGLMWAAYRSKGANYTKLPRVANDQYYATRKQTVNPKALLPGDLVFFASGSHWTSIYHVAMYIGGGKMIHAPTTGETVKIVPMRWSRLYAATRIFPAVPAPTTKPTPSPTPTPDPTPTDPAPTDPAPTDPDPTDPTPTDPEPTETTSPTPTATTEPTNPAPTGPTPTGTSGSPDPSETAPPSETATPSSATSTTLIPSAA